MKIFIFVFLERPPISLTFFSISALLHFYKPAV
jgi:hypothetical protein